MKEIETVLMCFIVCKTKTQAKDLFKRTVQQFHKEKIKMCADKSELVVKTPIETYWFIPERGMCDMLRNKRCVKRSVISGYDFDRLMDIAYKQKEAAE